MARPWRIQFPGAVYHVTARGNRRQNIFFTDADREDFLRLLGLAAERYQLRIFAFCLMTNHYHLFLQTPSPNLSAALHWLNATYSIRLNRRRRLSGHLLQGRFQAALAADPDHWMRLSLYIHLNPARAGLVDDPSEYEWSSCRDYLAPAPRFAWLDRGPALAAFGPGKAAVRRYRSALAGAADESPQYWAAWRREVDEAARAEQAARAKAHPPGGSAREVPEFRRLDRQAPDLGPELSRLARALKIAPAELLRRRRNFPPRLLAFYYLAHIKHIPVSTVAAFFSITPGAVSHGIAQSRQLIAADPDLAQMVDSLIH